MKRYIKTQNYIDLDDDIQTLIDEFDPYIEETQTDTDVDAIGYGWVAYRIKDRNSDFDEWIDVRLDEDGNIEEWDWNRQVFFDREYTDDKNLREIMTNPEIIDKVDNILFY